MNKTKIPWCDYTVNCFWGCENGCPYCAARNIARRFGRRIGTARGYPPRVINRMAKFQPVFLVDQLDKIAGIREPSRIFISFMGDAFGQWNYHDWLDTTFERVKQYPQHTFIFLTKQPQNLIEYSPYPPNCYIGVSVTANGDMCRAYYGLNPIKANVKFISFEPLLGQIGMSDQVNMKSWVNWVIIGCQTPISKQHPCRREWVEEIITAADKTKIPVFVKEPLASHYGIPRQEFPREVSR